MINLLYVIVVGVVIVVGIAVVKSRFKSGSKEWKYQYRKKDFFLSRAEHECYDALIEAVGNDYHIFAQVHLPTIVDNKIVGQNWRGAFRHISEKSVDFVLCDKKYISPKLAIELDDKTHQRPNRQERDREVERILHQAGVPLLRLENRGHFNPSELTLKIKSTFPTDPKTNTTD